MEQKINTKVTEVDERLKKSLLRETQRLNGELLKLNQEVLRGASEYKVFEEKLQIKCKHELDVAE